MKHFVTVFPPAENVDFVKDKGQIAYQMQKHLGYKSTMVCCRNSPDYPYINSEVPGLNVEFIENAKPTFFWNNAILSYIWREAQSIDVLNLYYLVQESLLYGLLYKFRNPDGVLYLKMDMNVNIYKKVGLQFSENYFKDQVHLQMYKLFKKKIDVVSVESNRAFNLLHHLDSQLAEKTIRLPNGLDFQQGWGQMGDNLYSKKENIILSVGRIGSKSKNNEFLLRALEGINLQNWEVYFVGPVAEEFEPKIESFFKRNPSLKEHVFFTGKVQDRQKLKTYYARAKIFCLPSRWEAFPLVLLEALSAGNYIIGTDRISSIEEITQDEKIGSIVELDNAEQLQQILKKTMEPEFYTRKLMETIISHAREYDWPRVLKKLDTAIKKCMRK
jgi:glycosyltransferase involved in cell wall biosynthesis